MEQVNPNHVPVYIKAKSKDELILKMMATVRLNGKAYNFHTPYPVKDGYEVWYFADVFRDKHIDDIFPNKSLKGVENGNS